MISPVSSGKLAFKLSFMAERPTISGRGEIVHEREEGRLFDVKMANGYVAIAVLAKDGPPYPGNVVGKSVEVTFSPYDMTRSKVIRWITED